MHGWLRTQAVWFISIPAAQRHRNLAAMAVARTHTFICATHRHKELNISSRGWLRGPELQIESVCVRVKYIPAARPPCESDWSNGSACDVTQLDFVQRGLMGFFFLPLSGVFSLHICYWHFFPDARTASGEKFRRCVKVSVQQGVDYYGKKWEVVTSVK